MTTLNANLFDHINIPQDPPSQNPLAHQVTVLPLNLIALIISHLDHVADLARVCQTSRVLHYMTQPQLYRNISLTSYDTIRYRDDQPEGQGSASPFAMGLNALVSRNVASLVHTLSLQGDWREYDLQEFSSVGRVPDNAMMLSIAVRAAVDRCTQLREFKWDLSSKLLSTVYYGLTNLQHLKSFHLRFPNTKSPRPTTTIPPMPNLESFIMTQYDPLCFPDDVSLLLLHASKLKTLILHFSPRMRDAGEPSVHMTNILRRNIAAKRPIRPTKIGIYNLFAMQNSEELMGALDPTALENVTFLNTFGQDEDTSQNSGSSSVANGMFSFFDQTWTDPPKDLVYIKSERHDRLHKRHVQLLQRFVGMERIYLVNARHNPPHDPTHNGVHNGAHNGTNGTNGTGPSPSSSNNSPATASSGRTPTGHQNIPLRDMYLSAIFTNHGATLRHLIFPSRWPLSPGQAAKLFRACPHLTQLSMGMDPKSFPQLGMLVPFLKHLWAMRLLPPPDFEAGHGGEKPSQCQALEDAMHEGIMGTKLAAVGEFLELRYVGLGDRVWEVGGFYEEMSFVRVPGSYAEGAEAEYTEEMVRKRRLKRVSLDEVRDVEIWKMDTQDVV
jgi:hypothetical protein